MNVVAMLRDLQTLYALEIGTYVMDIFLQLLFCATFCKVKSQNLHIHYRFFMLVTVRTTSIYVGTIIIPIVQVR